MHRRPSGSSLAVVPAVSGRTTCRFSAKESPVAAPLSASPPSVSRPTAALAPGLAGHAAEEMVQAGSPDGEAHIRVAVRVRPCPPSDKSIIEVAGDCAIALRKEAPTGGNKFLSSQSGRTEERVFDRVFGPEATQADVYAWTCLPLMTAAVVEGRCATVFVYGATGAGKTHTMFGEKEESQQGLIYRAVREVFATLELYRFGRMSDGTRLEVKVSFIELYNETVRDLLQEGGAICRVLEDERRGVVKVTNLREVPVQSSEEALKQLRVGSAVRKVEATAANARSSRSHAIFSLTVERVDPAPAGPGLAVFQRKGDEPRRLHTRISLVDLAGSERATQTQNVGTALRDGAKINQSLLALANCIDALVLQGRDGTPTNQRRKAPYRDSKLTLLLKASLCKDGYVSMIANVHPGQSFFEDSNNTLEYAKRSSTIRAPAPKRINKALTLPESPPESPKATPAADPALVETKLGGNSVMDDADEQRRAGEQICHRRRYRHDLASTAKNDSANESAMTGRCRPKIADAAPGRRRGGGNTGRRPYQRCGGGGRHPFQQCDDGGPRGASAREPKTAHAMVVLEHAASVCESSSIASSASFGSAESENVILDSEDDQAYTLHNSRSHREMMMSPSSEPSGRMACRARSTSSLHKSRGADIAAFSEACRGTARRPLEAVQPSENTPVLVEVIESMRHEKEGLCEQVSSLEKENARLRRANAQKDQQLVMLLGTRASLRASI